MKRLTSTSNSYDPSPRSMKSGWPPTARNARTGESTPPGSKAWASAKSSADLLVLSSGAGAFVLDRTASALLIGYLGLRTEYSLDCQFGRMDAIRDADSVIGIPRQ